MRKVTRIIVMAVMLCFAFAAVLSGCGSKAGQEAAGTTEPAAASTAAASSVEETSKPKDVKFSFWANAAEQKNFEFAVAGIEKKYPDVKVILQGYPTSDEFWAAVPTAIAAGVGPDVIGFSDEGNSDYMVNGVLEPLDDLISQVGMDKGKFVPTLLNGWTYDGKLYGIPYDTSTSMLCINADMWAKAGLKDYPKTMDELKTAAKALTKGEVKGICINLFNFHITQYTHAFGGDWGNGATIDTKENAAGLQFIADLFKEGLAITPQQLSASWDGEAFAKGKAAISTGGPWYIGYTKDANKDMKMVGVPIPMASMQAQSAYSHGLSITKMSQNKPGAMKLIDYMTRDEAQNAEIESVGYVPSVQSLIPNYIKSAPDYMKTIMDNMAVNGKAFAYPPETKGFDADLTKGMQDICLKSNSKLTVEQLLKDLQEKYGPKK